MAFCAKSLKSKRLWCKKTPCAVDNNEKDCVFKSETNRCRRKVDAPSTKKAKKLAPPAPKSATPSKAAKAPSPMLTRRAAKLAESKKVPPVRRSSRIAVNAVAEKKVIGTRARVLHGTADKTVGGLTKKDLVLTPGGIRSRKKHKTAKKNSWITAVSKARKELKVTGFVKVQKPAAGKPDESKSTGEKVYELAKKIHEQSK